MYSSAYSHMLRSNSSSISLSNSPRDLPVFKLQYGMPANLRSSACSSSSELKTINKLKLLLFFFLQYFVVRFYAAFQRRRKFVLCRCFQRHHKFRSPNKVRRKQVFRHCGTSMGQMRYPSNQSLSLSFFLNCNSTLRDTGTCFATEQTRRRHRGVVNCYAPQ